MVQDFATQWVQSYLCLTMRSLQLFLPPESKPGVIYTDNSLEITKGCEDLTWKRGKPTPLRSETIGIAERAVRRVNECTSTLSIQSGLEGQWWREAMECYLLCTRHSKFVSRWEDPSRKKKRHSVPWANKTTLSRDIYFIFQFPQRQKKQASSTHRKSPQILLDMP